MRDSGEQCVIISGGPAMLKWHADSLDSLLMVTYQNRMVHFIFSFCRNVFFLFFQEQQLTLMLFLVVEVDIYSWTMLDVEEESQDY